MSPPFAHVIFDWSGTLYDDQTPSFLATRQTIIDLGGRRISRADYDRAKLRSSMTLALRKRPVPREAVDDAISRIEEKLLSLAQREIKSDKLGELVMRELKRLDKVAYIRFASVYRSFEDVDEFAEVVREVRPAGRAVRRKRS